MNSEQLTPHCIVIEMDDKKEVLLMCGRSDPGFKESPILVPFKEQIHSLGMLLDLYAE